MDLKLSSVILNEKDANSHSYYFLTLKGKIQSWQDRVTLVQLPSSWSATLQGSLIMVIVLERWLSNGLF